MAGLLDQRRGVGLLDGLADAFSPGRVDKRTERDIALRKLQLLEDASRRKELPPQIQLLQAAGIDPRSPEGHRALFPRTDPPQQLQLLQAAGINPTSPEGRSALFPRANAPLSAIDRREIFKAEDEVPQLTGTIEALDRALQLNDKTYTGFGADLFGRLGTGAAGSLGMKPSPQASATVEWGKIMGSEAIKNMSETLKGATTNLELQKFVDLLSDPTTPADVRASVIKRMKTLAERQLQIKNMRMNELRGGDYFKRGGGPQMGQQPAQGQRPTGGDGWSVQRLD
jgi:hypothetical protein